MDILRVLTSPDLEVRRKTLDLVLDLMTSRNCEEVSFLVQIPFDKFYRQLQVF